MEAATVALADSRCPRCIGGQGACPPEDCGGDPRLRGAAPVAAPDRDELISWLGLRSPAAFDPARFDVPDADRRLADLLRSARPT